MHVGSRPTCALLLPIAAVIVLIEQWGTADQAPAKIDDVELLLMIL